VPRLDGRGEVPEAQAAGLKARLLALLGVHDAFDDPHPRPWREFLRPPVSAADRGQAAG
jgi:hypothetical protein